MAATLQAQKKAGPASSILDCLKWVSSCLLGQRQIQLAFLPKRSCRNWCLLGCTTSSTGDANSSLVIFKLLEENGKVLNFKLEVVLRLEQPIFRRFGASVVDGNVADTFRRQRILRVSCCGRGIGHLARDRPRLCEQVTSLIFQNFERTRSLLSPASAGS